MSAQEWKEAEYRSADVLENFDTGALRSPERLTPVSRSLTETEFLLARLSKLLALAEYLAQKSDSDEMREWFQTLTREIETILERLTMLRSHR